MTDEEIVDELYRVGHLRGLKPDAVKEAIGKVKDKRRLLRDWKRVHKADSVRILREIEEKALAQMAADSSEHHLVVREQARREREARRERMPLGRRLGAALAEATALSSVPSSMRGVERIKGGDRGNVMPVSVALEGLDAHLFVIESRLRIIEQDLDHYRGLGVGARATTMSGADKDAMIVSKEMEGRAPEDIAQAFPWLGSPLTVRRVRRRHGLRGKDGKLNPRSAAVSARAA